MIRKAIIDHHFAAYQLFLGLVTLTSVIHLLFHYSLAVSLGYGASTVVSFLLGQGVVALVQRASSRRRSGDSFD